MIFPTFVLLAAAPFVQGGATVAGIGPRGSTYTDIVASERNPLLALAVRMDGSVFRTRDGGQTYGEPILDLNGEGGPVGVGFDGGGIAYVMTPSALRISQDGGTTWALGTMPPSTGSLGAFDVAPSASGDLWAVDSFSTLFRSLDGGASWTTAGVAAVTAPWAIVLDSSDRQNLLIVGASGAALSSDGGATFTPLDGLFNFLFPGSVFNSADLLGDQILVTAVETNHGGPIPYILGSSDRGLSWTLRAGGLFSHLTWTVRRDPRDAERVYALSGSQSYKLSLDGGATFSNRTSASDSKVLDVAFPSQPSAYLIALTPNHVGRAGALQLAFDAAPGGDEPLEVLNVAIDPADDFHMAVVAEGNLYETHDRGASWRMITRTHGLPGNIEPRLRIDGVGRVLINLGGLAAWDGDTWSQLLDGAEVTSFAAGRSQPGALYAAIERDSQSAIGVSHNFGQTWSETVTCTTQAPTVFCSQSKTTELFAVERPGLPVRLVGLQSEPQNTWLHYTDDFGQTTVPVPSATARAKGLVQSPREPARLAVTFDGGYQVTADAFDSWTSNTQGILNGLALTGTEESGFLLRATRTSSSSPWLFEESFDEGLSFTAVPELGSLVTGFAYAAFATSEAAYIVGGRLGLIYRQLEPLVSEAGCEQATLNSAGRRATLRLFGSASIADAALRLDAIGLPSNVTCLCLGSMSAGMTPNPGGSLGDLCLGGEIGRFAGAVQSSSTSGVVSIDLDPAALPQPTGSVAAIAGSQWHFQCWHRDVEMGLPASHFTSSASVTWAH